MKRYYHLAMARVLNALATLGSRLMRNCGRWSNYHEDAAEEDNK